MIAGEGIDLSSDGGGDIPLGVIDIQGTPVSTHSRSASGGWPLARHREAPTWSRLCVRRERRVS